MTTIRQAREKLEAELATLRERAEKIIQTLDILAALDVVEPKAPKQKAEKVAKPKKAAKPGRAVKETPLPTTSGEWFLDLITTTPQSSAQIFEAAVKKVGGDLTKAALGKLKGRLGFNLNDLSNQGKIVKTDGEGKNKLYSLARS